MRAELTMPSTPMATTPFWRLTQHQQHRRMPPEGGGRERYSWRPVAGALGNTMFSTVLMSPVSGVRANTTYLLSLLVTTTVTVAAMSRNWPTWRGSAPQATASRPEGRQIISKLWHAAQSHRCSSRH